MIVWNVLFSVFVAACSTAEKSAKNKNEFGSLRKNELLKYYSEKLGIELDKNDDVRLAAAVTDWLGVPHRQGGQTKQGTDCSGFAGNIYKSVYGIDIPRSSTDIYNKCEPLKKEKLSEGDFVFFKVGSKHINHVGIYLKDNKFAHASTSRGVMVSSLDEPYWVKYWFAGGRLKQ